MKPNKLLLLLLLAISFSASAQREDPNKGFDRDWKTEMSEKPEKNDYERKEASGKVKLDQDPEEMAKQLVYLKNISNTKLSYSISTDNKNWSNDQISPYSTHTFKGSCYIKIATQNKGEVYYKLLVSRHYVIQWDYTEKKWDVLATATMD